MNLKKVLMGVLCWATGFGCPREPIKVLEVPEEQQSIVPVEAIQDRSWGLAFLVISKQQDFKVHKEELPDGAALRIALRQFREEELVFEQLYVYPMEPDEIVWGYFRAELDKQTMQ